MNNLEERTISIFQEILDECLVCLDDGGDTEFFIANAMKGYAEFYCEKFRTDLLNNCFNRDGIQLLDEIDIIQTKLPEHD